MEIEDSFASTKIIRIRDEKKKKTNKQTKNNQTKKQNKTKQDKKQKTYEFFINKRILFCFGVFYGFKRSYKQKARMKV